MKAYILTFLMSWALFTFIYTSCIAVSIAMFGFLAWYVPTDIAYMLLLRVIIVAAFVTTLFYMASDEGKVGLKAMKRVWK